MLLLISLVYRNPCGANYACRDEGRADPAPTSHDLLLCVLSIG